MKRTLLIFATVAAFGFTSCKENAADKVNEENLEMAADRDETPAIYPVMTFDKTEHDFGTIDQGTQVEHLFTFTNTGEIPLIITDAKGSCGCTVPNYTKEPVAPGEKGEILVKFNGTGQNQRTIGVTINTNTEKGTEQLTIKAFVNPKEGAATTPAVSAKPAS